MTVEINGENMKKALDEVSTMIARTETPDPMAPGVVDNQVAAHQRVARDLGLSLEAEIALDEHMRGVIPLGSSNDLRDWALSCSYEAALAVLTAVNRPNEV